MPIFGSVSFNDEIINAIENNTLVVFAGAGVSRGEPAYLPNFEELTKLVSKRHVKEPVKPYDKYLGELYLEGVNVHAIAADLLKKENEIYTELHKNILRLFKTVENIRIVTTNYDLLFENSCKSIYSEIPIIYQAPALPLGNSFGGIVHIHGDIKAPENMILTDIDFGKGYLTEGWARRFLVELFSKYTVLFIGYSYSDIILHYLVRAITSKHNPKLYILTEDGEQNGKIESLGIKPIYYAKDRHDLLNKSVELLADQITCPTFDWEEKVEIICRNLPPEDEEKIGEINYILSHIHTIRFFVKYAKSIEWLYWLDEHKYLNALFNKEKLCENEIILAEWISNNILLNYPDELYNIYSKHNKILNSSLVTKMCFEIIKVVDDESIFKNWRPILIKHVQESNDVHFLINFADNSFKSESYELVLLIFIHLLKVSNCYIYSDNDFMHNQEISAIKYIYSKNISVKIQIFANQLVLELTSQIMNAYMQFLVQDKYDSSFDPISYKRKAIENHKRDKEENSINIHINIMRDSMKYLSMHSQAIFEGFVEYYIETGYPLLNRLAIHTMCEYSKLNSDERINWLLNRIDIFSKFEHHEIFQILLINYKDSSETTRKNLVQKIIKKELNIREKFNWIMWLIKAKSDCNFAQEALKSIKEKYPDLEVNHHPDFNEYPIVEGWIGSESPWSIDEILEFDINDKIHDLVTFKEESFFGPNRDGLLNNIKIVCNNNHDWGIILAELLIENSYFETDIWLSILETWGTFDIDEIVKLEIVSLINNVNIQKHQAFNLSNFIIKLLSYDCIIENLPLICQLMEQLEYMWDNLDIAGLDAEISWYNRSINHTAGKIVLAWLKILSLLMKDKEVEVKSIPDEFKKIFEKVINDKTIKGDYGYCIIASRLELLLELDDLWTKNKIISLLIEKNKDISIPLLSGFLYARINIEKFADVLLPIFVNNIESIDGLVEDEKEIFIMLFVYILIHHVTNGPEELVTKFYKYASISDRIIFIDRIRENLEQMESQQKENLWNNWLCLFIGDRLNNKPKLFHKSELGPIFNLLPYLDEKYPEAVEMFVKFSETSLEEPFGLHLLKDNELITKYQDETAKLLIWLAECSPTYIYDDLKYLSSKLTNLDSNIKYKMEEKLFIKGIS